MKAITSQRKQIHRLCKYSRDIEALHVQQVTGDQNKTTAGDLSVKEASQLIQSLTTNWGHFNKDNGKHLYILSLMRQANWTVPHSEHGKIPDIGRLSDFLKSAKSPVQKPLLEMDREETSKIIFALEGIVRSKFK